MVYLKGCVLGCQETYHQKAKRNKIKKANTEKIRLLFLKYYL